jgi:murein DD-endopeptidase MepM/ murein hydrolase activator NlpD
VAPPPVAPAPAVRVCGRSDRLDLAGNGGSLASLRSPLATRALLPARPTTRSGLLATALLVALAAGCASDAGSGLFHRVERGENLYRIGLRYGVSADAIVRANDIDDVHAVPVGTKLWIPQPAGVGARPTAPRATRPTAPSEARRLARLDARRTADLDFTWPVQGRVTSGFGRRSGRGHDGVDVSARKGTPIRAAEAGRVIHSGRLGDYGNVVIVKHEGDYRTVYAHASETLVRKGQFVEKGERIALVGATGRASGPHLHFEIRRRENPRDPLLYLP